MKTGLTLFLIAFSLRLAAILFWQFDGLYGQDAHAYFQQAVALTKNLPQGQPPPPDFFWPNGYPLLIAFLMLLVGQTALAGQLAALLCGTLLAPLAYLLSSELFIDNTPDDPIRINNLITTRSELAGLLAGLILATAGQPILSSIVIMADMPALFWATLATWLTVHASVRDWEPGVGDWGLGARRQGLEAKEQEAGGRDQGSGRAHASRIAFHVSLPLCFFAAGAALAMAVISRWLYLLIVPALCFYVIFQMRRHKIGWWQPGLAGLGGMLILAPQFWLSLNKPEGLAHTFLLSWSPLNFFQRQFESSEGYFSYLLPMALFYAQPAGHPAYIFPLLGLAALWGLWRLRQTRHWAALILLLGWAGPVYLFLAGITFQNFRFGLTLYLPLVLLTGFGLSDLWLKLPRRRPSLNSGTGAGEQRGIFSSAPLLLRSPTLLKAGLALSLAGMLLWAYPMLDNFLTTHNHSKTIARQVEQLLPPQASLLAFGLTLTLQHYTTLNTLELFYLDPPSLDKLTRSQRPLYLFLDLDNIETQWQGKTPQLNYQWLKENRTLTEIGVFPPYTLFRISALDK